MRITHIAYPVLPEGADVVLDGSDGGCSAAEYIAAIGTWAVLPDAYGGPQDDVEEAIADANDWLEGTDIAIDWHPDNPGCLMIGTYEWWNEVG